MIRVAAIDDETLLLESLGTWIQGLADIELVATDTTVARYLDSGIPADVVLLDLNLRDHTSVEDNVRTLVSAGLRVLVVSTIPDVEYVVAAIEAGATGYVTKDKDLRTLAEAIRDAAQGKPTVTVDLAFLLSVDGRPTRPKLSKREREVLWHYGRGTKLDSVARKLGIRPATAREYIARVKAKYQEVGRPAYTRTELADRIREDRLELDSMGSSDSPQITETS